MNLLSGTQQETVQGVENRSGRKQKQEEYDSIIAENDTIIKALTNGMDRLKDITGHDGTNHRYPHFQQIVVTLGAFLAELRMFMI